MNEKDVILDNFRKHFEAMTHEERDKYLREMGLKFEYIDSPSTRKISLWKDTVIVERVDIRADKFPKIGKLVKGPASRMWQLKIPNLHSVMSQPTASNKSRQSNPTHEEVEEQVGKEVELDMK